MIRRIFIRDPLFDASKHGNDDYLLVYQIPEKSRNEAAFLWMLEQLEIEYIHEEAKPRKPRERKTTRVVDCSFCRGTGLDNVGECGNCGGTGRVPDHSVPAAHTEFSKPKAD